MVRPQGYSLPQSIPDPFSVSRRLIAVVGHAAIALLVVLAVLLLLRRLSGAFQRPLGGAAIILAAVVLEAAGCGLRRLFENTALQHSVLSTQYLVLSTKNQSVSSASNPEIRVPLVGVVCTVATAAVLLALSIPGTPPVALVVAWLAIVAGETAQWLPHLRLTAVQRPAAEQVMPQPTTAIPPDAELDEPEISPGLVHQITRVVENGQESIHALVKATVAASDRLAVVHIAFCPPLTERPELSAHALDCDEAEIRLTQIETFGARLEARLPNVSDRPRSMMIEVLGVAKANPSS